MFYCERRKLLLVSQFIRTSFVRKLTGYCLEYYSAWEFQVVFGCFFTLHKVIFRIKKNISLRFNTNVLTHLSHLFYSLVCPGTAPGHEPTQQTTHHQ